MRLFEVTIGAPDLGDAAAYWAKFGYKPVGEGAVAAAEAFALYGWESGVRSRRLQHGKSPHGLVRLMQWERPRNEGLGLKPNAVAGGRWVAHKTDDLPKLEFHTYLARDQGRPIRIDGPVDGRYAVKPDSRAFWDAIPAARDVVVIQPLSRQLFFAWFDMPGYAQVDPDSAFKTSEIAHAAFAIQGGEEVLDFYVNAFDMTRMPGPPPGDEVPLTLFGVEDKATVWHKHFVQDAENPPLGDSINPPPGDRNGGRLMAVRFPNGGLEDCRALSMTGCLGLTTYTVRTSNLEALRQRVDRHGGLDLTPTAPNEFREPSFAFTAPDGYGWIAVEN